MVVARLAKRVEIFPVAVPSSEKRVAMVPVAVDRLEFVVMREFWRERKLDKTAPESELSSFHILYIVPESEPIEPERVLSALIFVERIPESVEMFPVAVARYPFVRARFAISEVICPVAVLRVFWRERIVPVAVLRNELVSARSEKRVAMFPVAVARFEFVTLIELMRLVIPEFMREIPPERVVISEISDTRVFSVLITRPERENIEPESASSSARRNNAPDPVI